jgi:formylglycine-generating enzyme required for sulfatase activity
MEFIPGETLQQRLDRVGPLDMPEVLRIGREIAEGLAAAHAMDLIHRDIKPGNVLLEGGQQKVKITDFGLARTADDASISQSGIIVGTPMYMAPEQALGQTLDQRADLFSLGSVLYQMAAGRPPFRASTTMAVLKRVAEDQPRAIREIIPETPQWLCDIIAKLHAKGPADRYQSAREVADVLADCEAQLKANASLKDYSRVPRGQPRRSARRNWVAAAAVLLLPVIALAVSEFVGVTHLFLGQQATRDPIKPGDGSTRVSAAKQGPLPPTFKNGIGMEFVIVPNGKSWLGGSKDKLGDKEVEIAADFYLGKYEVTQEEWEKVMGESPSCFSRTGDGKDAVRDIPDADLKRFPVENVSWDQCQVFVEKLNKLEKETGWVYRLPKLTEWEYACRGGLMVDKADSAFDYYLAKPTNTLLPEDANFDKGMNRTCKVGSYKPNRLGLFDLHGNVQEWCEDSEQATTDYGKRLRGGSFRIGQCETKGVAAGKSTFRGDDLGLRLARVPSGAPSPEVRMPPAAVAPFTDADVQRVAALPAADQVEEVRKELMRRNPGFDGDVHAMIKGGVITGLEFITDRVTDISPVRELQHLHDLKIWGSTIGKGWLADLSPLKGMKLTHLDVRYNHEVHDLESLRGMPLEELTLWGWAGSDLTPLQGMPLRWLNCGGGGQKFDFTPLAGLPLEYLCVNHTQVSDLTSLKNVPLRTFACSNTPPLKDLPLTELYCDQTKVSDLLPLKGTPLKVLHIHVTGITDLAPLQGMPLEDIHLTPKNITKGLDILRAMKSLKTIGIAYNQSWPAAAFWERYDRGEFKE